LSEQTKEKKVAWVRESSTIHINSAISLQSTHEFKGESMNKADLIEKVAKDAGVSKVQADAAISSLLDGILATLKKGGAVTLVGFGTFSVGSRKARTGRNPQTGAAIKIAAKKVPKFSAGIQLKKAVNKK
jgi:DNA-binding protein HU-beta